MKNERQFSINHALYIKSLKNRKIFIISMRFIILFAGLGLWELLSRTGVIDSFISSSPSGIINTLSVLVKDYDLFYHIGVTLYETLLGFIIAVGLGYLIAILLWCSEKARLILEPYIVVLNSLPKIALGPIIIVWCGSGSKAIIFMAVLVGIIVAIIAILNGFMATDKNKILLLRSMGANKFQVLTKLVIPGSLPTLISTLKISVGMAWIGSIMGEYLVSKAGLGYLIVYGGQVFKLDLVMTATVILCVLAGFMYFAVTLLEKFIIKYKND